MSRPAFLLALVVAALGLDVRSIAAARSLTADRLKPAKDDPESYLIDGRYQRGEARLARMRRSGELPDTIRASGCHFDLAGDPGVAYYVKSCP